MYVATNQMRRDAAKRKLAGQQARRAQQAARRRRIAVISSAAVVVVVLVAVVLLSTLGRGGSDPSTAAAASVTPTSAAEPTAGAPTAVTPASIPTATAPLPTRSTPLPDTVSCEYPAGGQAAKPVDIPPTGGVNARGTESVTLQTSAGAIPLTLDRALAPCTVNSFVSLARQRYFDATTCHRLTTDPGLQVLQCGDPTGTGSGGPGYTIPDEVFNTLTYGRGLLAMAKTSAPNSGGSQFFMVYGDAQLPPDYTVFGSIGADGLQVLDQIARTGQDNSLASSAGGGKPVQPVTIETATVG
jgi:peptidyl-prolyl cis-trans isomerase B (cyclophilin B)